MRYEPIFFGNKGLNLNNQVIELGSNVFTKLDNWEVGQDNSSSNRLGVLVKKNASDGTTITALPASGRCRGLKEFFPQSSQELGSYIFAAMVTTEYTEAHMYFHNFNSASTWKVLTETDGTTTQNMTVSHWSFASRFDTFRVVDTLYMCNGSGFYKYFSDNISDSSTQAQIVKQVSDCGGTAIDATTAAGDVTWTEDSDIVTIAADTFVAGVTKGTWIRESSTAQWYEVEERVSTTELRLRSIFQEATATSATAEYAPAFNRYPKFVIHWKDCNVAANFSTAFAGLDSAFALSGESGVLLISGAPDDGDELLISDNADNAAGEIIFSDILSDATPAALETWSGVNAAGDDNAVTLTTLFHGITNITAIASLGEYFFVFGDREYVTYRYNADPLTRVTEVARKRKGCNSIDTIQAVEDYLIYFTGLEVRMTNGFSDVLLSEDIANDIKNNCYVQNAIKYYSNTASDNNMPSSFYDSFNDQYHLYLTSKDDVNIRYDYCYDITKKQWVSGRENAQNIAKKIEVLSYPADTETTADKFSYHFPITSTDQMYKTFLQTGRSAVQVAGEIQSGDMFFGDITKKKQLREIEFWVHVGVSSSVTFDFNFWLDNEKVMATDQQFTVTNTSATDDNYFQKVNLPISGEGFNFRWSLEDTAWTGSSTLAIVGGWIGWESLNKDK